MKRFSRYLAALSRANALGDHVEWLFYPGMLQESRDKWWDDFGRRPCAHEGMDICFYRTKTKKMNHLSKTAQIPAMDNGIVLNICNDFLGQSLVVTHGKETFGSPDVILVYSHLEIQKNIAPGSRLEKDQIIARVFDTSQKQSKLLPHLHISCIELTRQTPVDALDWGLFADREKVNLINPVFI